MSLKSDLTYLLDKHRISKGEYLKFIGNIDGHDRSLRNKTIVELKQRIEFAIKDCAEIQPDSKKIILEIVKDETNKMRNKND